MMSLPRSARVLSLLCLLGTAFAANPPAAAQPAILPQTFRGWQLQAAPEASKDPTAADPANAAILKEYRFSDFAAATYAKDDGRTLKIRAARFEDASGAFGAYTFYLQPEMNKEQIGDQGASLHQRVLFYRGQVLVDAQFSKESAMSGADLRELAGMLPRPSGNLANLPGFIEFMPRRDYITNSQKYVMGPQALAALAPPVSADVVDFRTSSEVSLGRYHTLSGEATLMLISYPTPQLAADHYRRIESAHQQGQQPAGVATIGNAGTFLFKRTGPIIAIASGPASESDEKSLLGLVNYEANVTWNQATDQHEVRDLYMLVMNVVILCAVLGGLAIIAGVAFGGFRILMKRWFPDRVFDRPEQMEFISLHLTETVVERGAQAAPTGPPSAPQNHA